MCMKVALDGQKVARKRGPIFGHFPANEKVARILFFGLRCNTGEYPRVRVPVIFSKAITRTQRVFRHGYPWVSLGTITNTRGTRGTRRFKSSLACPSSYFISL